MARSKSATTLSGVTGVSSLTTRSHGKFSQRRSQSGRSMKPTRPLFLLGSTASPLQPRSKSSKVGSPEMPSFAPRLTALRVGRMPAFTSLSHSVKM